MRSLVLGVALFFAFVAGPAWGQPGSNADRCHQAIALGMEGVKRGRTGQLSRCLKFGNYSTCIDGDPHTQEHENDLRRKVAGERSACQAALDEGAVVADFGPAACNDEWADCDSAIPSVSTLDDVAECVICHEHGFDLEIRSVLGWPRATPTDADERRCTRGIAHLTALAIKRAVHQTAVCARGGSKPFACPVDASPENRFGRALASIENNVAMCGIDEGKAPGALTNLCGGQATDSSTLAACFVGLAKCLACRTANSALGQSEDCVSFSGFADCDGAF